MLSNAAKLSSGPNWYIWHLCSNGIEEAQNIHVNVPFMQMLLMPEPMLSFAPWRSIA